MSTDSEQARSPNGKRSRSPNSKRAQIPAIDLRLDPSAEENVRRDEEGIRLQMHNLAEQFKDPKNQLIHKDSVRMSTDKSFIQINNIYYPKKKLRSLLRKAMTPGQVVTIMLLLAVQTGALVVATLQGSQRTNKVHNMPRVRLNENVVDSIYAKLKEILAKVQESGIEAHPGDKKKKGQKKKKYTDSEQYGTEVIRSKSDWPANLLDKLNSKFLNHIFSQFLSQQRNKFKRGLVINPPQKTISPEKLISDEFDLNSPGTSSDASFSLLAEVHLDEQAELASPSIKRKKVAMMPNIAEESIQIKKIVKMAGIHTFNATNEDPCLKALRKVMVALEDLKQQILIHHPSKNPAVEELVTKASNMFTSDETAKQDTTSTSDLVSTDADCSSYMLLREAYEKQPQENIITEELATDEFDSTSPSTSSDESFCVILVYKNVLDEQVESTSPSINRKRVAMLPNMAEESIQSKKIVKMAGIHTFDAVVVAACEDPTFSKPMDQQISLYHPSKHPAVEELVPKASNIFTPDETTEPQEYTTLASMDPHLTDGDYSSCLSIDELLNIHLSNALIPDQEYAEMLDDPTKYLPVV